MKKEDITSLIVYVLLIAAAVITACTVLSDAFQYYNGAALPPQIFTIFVIIAAILTNFIGLELFHALGAKIGGYEVVAINVLGFCFEKSDKSWKFKFSDFEGLTGETRILRKNDKASLKPYVWLPLIGYLAEFALMIVLYSLVSNSIISAGWLAPFAIVFIVVSSMIALYNIVPFKLDTMTDGYRMVLISKPENIEAFDELMRIENLARNGKQINNLKTFKTVNDFTANANLYYVYEKINQKKYKEAIEVLDDILENEEIIDEYTYFGALAQKLYCLIQLEDLEEAKKNYKIKKDAQFRRFLVNNKSIETLRSYILIAGFIEESRSEVKYCESKNVQKYQSYAARFAAKEAFSKALGTGFVFGATC